MIVVHGFKNIARKIEEIRPRLKSNEISLLIWPGHFGVTIARRSEAEFEYTLHNAKQSDVETFMTELKAING